MPGQHINVHVLWEYVQKNIAIKYKRLWSINNQSETVIKANTM